MIVLTAEEIHTVFNDLLQSPNHSLNFALETLKILDIKKLLLKKNITINDDIVKSASKDDSLMTECWYCDHWPSPTAFLRREGPAYYYVYAVDGRKARSLCLSYLSSTSSSLPSIVTFAATETRLIPAIRSVFNIKCSLTYNRFVFPSGTNIPPSKPLLTPYELCELSIEDASIICQYWDQSDEVSYVEQCILTGLNACIRCESLPICWALVHSDAAIGIVHTMDCHRRQGLAEIVIHCLLGKLYNVGILPFCYIAEKNEISKSLFKKCGFVYDTNVSWLSCRRDDDDGYEIE